MVGQHSGDKEEKWETASMCGLHKSKQSLPQGSLLGTSKRPVDGCNSRSSSDKFFRCLSRVPSDTIGSK